MTIQEIKRRKREIGQEARNKSLTAEQIRSLSEELDRLNLQELQYDEEEFRFESQEERNTPSGRVDVLATYGIGNTGQSYHERSADPYDTSEYRSAFMDYVSRGVESEGLEFRETTGTSDLGAVIPTTILNRIVERLRDYGHIWSRVTKTSVQGGVDIPISRTKPTASWVSSGTASKQKKTTSGKISFRYHKLQCTVAVELIADTVSLSIFEETVTENIYEAMIVALEESIINGTGDGQPLGITKDTNIPETQIVEITPADFGKYNKWTELYGKMPRNYRNRSVLITSDNDWSKYLLGMVDEVGQPVGRVNYGIDGTQSEKLLGKEVIAVEDYLPSIDDAAEGEIVAILVSLEEYMFNSNMQMLFKRYFDESTDEWISKSTLIGDGRLSDPHGVVLIKKSIQV